MALTHPKNVFCGYPVERIGMKEFCHYILSRSRKDVRHFLQLSRLRRKLLGEPVDHDEEEKSMITCKELDVLVGEIIPYAPGRDRVLYSGLPNSVYRG